MSGGVPVTVAGVGIHPFGKHEAGPPALARRAVDEALARADLTIGAIDEVFVANALAPAGVAAAVAEACGVVRVPVTRVEQACASGSVGLRLAAERIASGERSAVLVVGVERMGGGLLDLGDADGYATRMGLDVLPLLYGLKCRQYLETYGFEARDVAEVAARAHRKAVAAPHARFGLSCSADDVLASPMIADPVTRLAMAGNADGAGAAVLVAGAPSAAPQVTLRGWCGALESIDPAEPIRDGWDHQERLAAFLAAQLYEQAGIGPESIDMVQLSDPSAIAEPLSLEALGFAGRGEGLAASNGGGGPIVNTDGGLVGRGHSLAATALAMLYELWLQMRGEAGARQVDRPVRSALLHSHGVGGDNLMLVTR